MNIVHKAVISLGLKKPFRINLKPKIKHNAEGLYWGLYRRGKLISHRIDILFGPETSRDTDTLILHELIHAWQEENGFKDIHGASFRSMAWTLVKLTGKAEIYLPDTDE